MADNDLTYQSGFGNEHASESLPGALPSGRNSPQRAPYGLYTEQLTGTSFTAPRAETRRSWLYRIRPTVQHGKFGKVDYGHWRTAPLVDSELTPNRLRWAPRPLADEATDFVEGMRTIAASGDAEQRLGAAIHIYGATRSMERRVFSSHESELLIVPYRGALRLVTELGILDVGVGEIALLPKAIKFRVELLGGPSQGFVCENYGQPFQLPELGPIGSNGLANARDFLAPVARYEDIDGRNELVVKAGGRLWACETGHSPLDVVAWHGNHVPYKYDLRRFNTINTVSYDHSDHSIYTVLSSPSGLPGTANVELAAFTPRWLVAEDTFRPPWFHRNVMSELVAMIEGASESRASAFGPGACTLHNSMAAHGPDPSVFRAASSAELQPVKQGGIMALFESRIAFRATRDALEAKELVSDYDASWNALEKHFDPSFGGSVYSVKPSAKDKT